MKILYKYLTVFSLILLIAGCSREPVKVGFISGLSGGNSDLGEAGRNGAMMAVEEINETGGIDGQGVSLLIRDDGNDTEKAAAAAQELADE
ncbi:MAG: ABC transporter substrate-binding protein, partial [Spirochaetales bacterium]|nr:ABC transporter substrate-binding protein [Spirochaetales bacterium]